MRRRSFLSLVGLAAPITIYAAQEPVAPETELDRRETEIASDEQSVPETVRAECPRCWTKFDAPLLDSLDSMETGEYVAVCPKVGCRILFTVTNPNEVETDE